MNMITAIIGTTGVELQECGGKFRLLSRLTAAPPDAALLEDVMALGWLDRENTSSLEELQVEFTRLFSAPGPDAIPAHQSIYTDTLRINASGPDKFNCGMASEGREFKGYLCGESCARLKHCYDAVNFEPSDPAPAMVDHISTQLAFMAHLYLMEARETAEGKKEEARSTGDLRNKFYAEFLGRWAAEFTRKLAANPVSRLYGNAGQVIREALEKQARNYPEGERI